MVRELPAIVAPKNTQPSPLDGFLVDREGWERVDADTWHYTPRDITIHILGPGNLNRFQCSIKGSKPTQLATRAGVETWVVRAEGNA